MSARKKINVGVESSTSTFLLRPTDGTSVNCKEKKRTLDMLLFRIRICLSFSLQVSVLIQLPDCYIPSLVSPEGLGEHDWRLRLRSGLGGPARGRATSAETATSKRAPKKFCMSGTGTSHYFFLLCCRRACNRCLAPAGLGPVPMEKEGVPAEPKGAGLKP